MKNKFVGEQVGKVNYGIKVVKTIISLATKEISGVVDLQGKKISIEKNGDILNIDVFINVLASVTCSEIAYRVQENIKNSVESMTTYKTDVINVNVLGVKFEEN